MISITLASKGNNVGLSNIIQDVWSQNLFYYPINLRLTSTMKKDRLSPDSTARIRQYSSGIWCYFSISQIYSIFCTCYKHSPPTEVQKHRTTDKWFQLWNILKARSYVASVSGIAILYFLLCKTTVNGSQYINLLRKKLKLYMDSHRCSISMRDGAPCHRPRTV